MDRLLRTRPAALARCLPISEASLGSAPSYAMTTLMGSTEPVTPASRGRHTVARGVAPRRAVISNAIAAGVLALGCDGVNEHTRQRQNPGVAGNVCGCQSDAVTTWCLRWVGHRRRELLANTDAGSWGER